jgi:hypothetical protein
MDQLSNPAFSTPIGLLLWGATHAGEEPIGYAAPSPLAGVGGRIADWFRGLFPG